MILLFGRMADPIVANLSTHLAARSAELLLIDPARREDEWTVEWQGCGEGLTGTLQIGGRTVDARMVRSMFLREMWWSPSADQEEQPHQRDRLRARVESLRGLSEAFAGLVVNRSSACCTNASKPYQLQLIRTQGFRIPHTLVTMKPDAAREFYATYRGQVIYKSISAERSIVKQLTPEDLPRLEHIRSCPVQLQEMVQGVDIRVHVVGEQVFATEIHSEAPDYRYAERTGGRREMRPITLPDRVAAHCVSLTKQLGLVVGGVDLRRTPDGDYYCFEVNPSPAYLWFEDVTGQRIGRAIAELLCREVNWN